MTAIAPTSSNHRCGRLASLVDLTLLLLNLWSLKNVFFFFLNLGFVLVFAELFSFVLFNSFYSVFWVPSHQHRGPTTHLKRDQLWAMGIFSTLLVFCCFLNNLCYFTLFCSIEMLIICDTFKINFKYSDLPVIYLSQRQTQNERKFPFVS